MQQEQQPGQPQPPSNVEAPPAPVAKPRRSPVRRFVRTFAVLIVVFLVAFTGTIAANRWMGDRQLTPFATSGQDGNQVLSADERSIASVVERVSPSVVSIVTSSSNAGRSAEAAGTGMIVTADGYILTNKHVVQGARDVSVVTTDGTIYESVEVVGSDPLNDVAFLKIGDVNDLPAVAIGDSKTVRTGQSVVAIGNALGQFQNTVTSGIVSGLGRPVVASTDGTAAGAESLSDLIQTDAAINSGNSGGPLLNMQGQVIGINTAVAEDANSIGFAIPIGATKGMLKHLIETGEVERAVIGVQYVSITPEVKAEYELSVTKGDYVFSESGNPVRVGSPAAEAGLENGDIITKVNDQSIDAGKSVSTLIGEFTPGATVQLTIVRGDDTIQKRITLEAFED